MPRVVGLGLAAEEPVSAPVCSTFLRAGVFAEA